MRHFTPFSIFQLSQNFYIKFKTANLKNNKMVELAQKKFVQYWLLTMNVNSEFKLSGHRPFLTLYIVKPPSSTFFGDWSRWVRIPRIQSMVWHGNYTNAELPSDASFRSTCKIFPEQFLTVEFFSFIGY